KLRGHVVPHMNVVLIESDRTSSIHWHLMLITLCTKAGLISGLPLHYGVLNYLISLTDFLCYSIAIPCPCEHSFNRTLIVLRLDLLSRAKGILHWTSPSSR